MFLRNSPWLILVGPLAWAQPPTPRDWFQAALKCGAPRRQPVRGRVDPRTRYGRMLAALTRYTSMTPRDRRLHVRIFDAAYANPNASGEQLARGVGVPEHRENFTFMYQELERRKLQAQEGWHYFYPETGEFPYSQGPKQIRPTNAKRMFLEIEKAQKLADAGARANPPTLHELWTAAEAYWNAMEPLTESHFGRSSWEPFSKWGATGPWGGMSATSMVLNRLPWLLALPDFRIESISSRNRATGNFLVRVRLLRQGERGLFHGVRTHSSGVAVEHDFFHVDKMFAPMERLGRSKGGVRRYSPTDYDVYFEFRHAHARNFRQALWWGSRLRGHPAYREALDAFLLLLMNEQGRFLGREKLGEFYAGIDLSKRSKQVVELTQAGRAQYGVPPSRGSTPSVEVAREVILILQHLPRPIL